MTLRFPFDNSYARLPEALFSRQRPTPVQAPRLLAWNSDLAQTLGLSGGPDPAILAGNEIPDGADPLAQAYAGHQFGGFSASLGDGRAILLGEVVDQKGVRRDIQLKGSGRTPYSRAGDGRAWLGPVLREYIVSEAMNALGIPTTRALAAVATGENIQRETALPGAILTRVASSHLRVGHFEYFAARDDRASLRALFEFAVDRHRSPKLSQRRHRAPIQLGRKMAWGRLHPRGDEHRQHLDIGRNHRLWSLRLPGILSSPDSVQLNRPARSLRL